MSLPQWKGLFDWSMKYQDGTKPTTWDAADYDPQKMKWLEGVLKHYMQDFAARMQQIKSALDTGVGTRAQGEHAAEGQAEGQPNEQVVLDLRDKELLLEELMDIVGSIDFARDLHKIGGLATLIDLLSCPHPSLQWRAAEVVATCVANNPPVQQWFLDGGVLPPLMRLLATHATNDTAAASTSTTAAASASSSSDAGQSAQQASEDTSQLRIKGLLAISGLVRHHAPSLEAALSAGLLPQLACMCSDSDARVQRKAFSLAQYVASQRPNQAGPLEAGGALSAAISVLQHSGHTVEGSDLRCAALGLMLQLAQQQDGWDALHRLSQLTGSLSSLAAGLASLPAEDKDSCEDEVQAVSSLQVLLSGPRPAAITQAAASDHVVAGNQLVGPITLHVGNDRQ